MAAAVVPLAFAGWLLSGVVLAQPAAETGTFTWDAEAPCLDDATAKAALTALLGRHWLKPGVRITVELVRVDEGFALSVRTEQSGEPAERSLQDSSCEALSEAGILVVALAIRPELELGPGDLELLDSLQDRPTEPEEPKAPEDLPKPGPEPKPEPEPEPDPPAEQPPRTITGAMTLRGGVGWGMLPTLEGGLAAGAALLLPKARVEVDGRGWFGPPASVTGPANVAISGWTVGLRGGPSWTSGRLVLPLMLGTEVGQLIGRPEGLRDPTVQRPTWWAFTAAFGVVYSPIERLGLTAMLEGFVAVSRPSFSVEGYDQDVHTPREGGIRALLGVEARFPR